MYSRAHSGSLFMTPHWINTYGGFQGIRPIKLFCEEEDKSDMNIVQKKIKVTWSLCTGKSKWHDHHSFRNLDAARKSEVILVSTLARQSNQINYIGKEICDQHIKFVIHFLILLTLLPLKYQVSSKYYQVSGIIKYQESIIKYQASIIKY